MTRSLIAGLLGLGLLAAAPAQADLKREVEQLRKEARQDASRDNDRERNRDRETRDRDWLRFTLSDKESRVLRERYRSRERDPQPAAGLPPGLAKKAARGQPLPPGWQKKLARGEVIEARTLGHAERVPERILRDLPRQPEGTVLVKVEGKLVRLHEATRTIIDVLDL